MLNSTLVKRVKMSIADILIEARCIDDGTGLEISEANADFAVDEGQADCLIDVYYGDLPTVPQGKELCNFGNYSFQESGNKLVLRMFGSTWDNSISFVRRLAVFEPDFSHGDLYICPRNRLPIGIAMPEEIEKKSLDPFAPPFDEILLINLLSLTNGLHVHALGIIHEDNALLFCGVSGAGKSTMAELWKKRGAGILSDDRISLRWNDGQLWAFGTPWHGDARVHLAEKARLKTILFITHGKDNKIISLNPFDIATRLLVRCFPPFYLPKSMENTLNAIDKLALEVPCYEFQFAPDQRAVDEVLRYFK